tara:strand:+ start:143 stop:721 length:579 start_codon:yes stop_codon:yes gene_type:complete
MSFIKKILDKSKGPQTLVIMGIISFIESIFFILPPDPFLGLLCIARKIKKVIYYVFICTSLSVLGGCVAYLLGEKLFELAVYKDIKFITNNIEQINQLKLRLNNETFWLMITSAFTPLPFKIFCISAGLAKVNFIPFLLGSIIGRGLRFLIVGMLAYKYGTKFEEILKSKKIGYLMIGLISFLIIYLYYKWK